MTLTRKVHINFNSIQDVQSQQSVVFLCINLSL